MNSSSEKIESNNEAKLEVNKNEKTKVLKKKINEKDLKSFYKGGKRKILFGDRKINKVKKQKILKRNKKNITKRDMIDLSLLLGNLDLNIGSLYEAKDISTDKMTDLDLQKIFKIHKKNFKTECSIQKRNGCYYKYIKGILNDFIRKTLKFFIEDRKNKIKVLSNILLIFNEFFDELISSESKPNLSNNLDNTKFFLPIDEIFSNQTITPNKNKEIIINFSDCLESKGIAKLFEGDLQKNTQK